MQWGRITGSWSANAYVDVFISFNYAISFSTPAFAVSFFTNKTHNTIALTQNGKSTTLGNFTQPCYSFCSSDNTHTAKAIWWIAIGI